MTGKRGEDSSKDDTVNKLILKKAVKNKISSILKKAFISEKEVYDLVRGFFKKFLNIDYEFTREELAKELRKVYLSPELQKKVNNIFMRVSEIEHVSRTFQKEDLVKVLSDFSLMVDELIVAHYKKESSFFGRIGDSIHNLFSRNHGKMLEAEGDVLSENERLIIRMNMLLDNSKRWSDKDLERAKKSYQELLVLYNSLDENKKKAFYRPVQELFNIIHSKGNN